MTARPFLAPGEAPPAEPPRFPGKPAPGRPPHRRVLAAILGGALAVAAPAAAMATTAPSLPDEGVWFGGEWLTEPREVEVARLFRAVPAAEREAWMRMVRRVVAGRPARLAAYRMHRELGLSPLAARASVADVERRAAERPA